VNLHQGFYFGHPSPETAHPFTSMHAMLWSPADLPSSKYTSPQTLACPLGKKLTVVHRLCVASGVGVQTVMSVKGWGGSGKAGAGATITSVDASCTWLGVPAVGGTPWNEWDYELKSGFLRYRERCIKIKKYCYKHFLILYILAHPMGGISSITIL
jgi:hypothetical protein